MENSIKSRQFILREVAPADFLDDIISNQEWSVRINDSVTEVIVDGISTQDVQYNDLLRTLVWSNLAAGNFDILSCALSFDHALASCHGTVTTGSNHRYLVESVAVSGGDSSVLTLQSPGLSASPAYYEDDAPDRSSVNDGKPELDDLVPLPNGQAQLKQMVQDMIKAAGQEEETLPLKRSLEMEDMNLAVVDTQATTKDSSNETSTPTAFAKLMSYTTRKRPKGVTDETKWEYYASLGVGTEEAPILHSLIYLGDTDITNYVAISGDHFAKEAGITTQPDQSGFDITFTGFSDTKSFTGTLILDGKEYDWKGHFSALQDVPRPEANKPVIGSDGHRLDPLLLTVSSLARTPEGAKSEDLAQKQADIILGRLMMGSVDKDISDLLFKNVFDLSVEERQIQSKGPEFLKRAGVHHVLKTIKLAEKVKQSIKDKINLDKCDRFIPMCLAPVAPADVTKDPVFLYGLDRTKDKALVDQLQSEAQAVQEACYIAGYRNAVSEIQPYLKNAGEWYDRLDTTIRSSTFVRDWMNKISSSPGISKMMWSLKTTIEVLWQVTQERDEFKKSLKQDVKPPIELYNILNGAGLLKAQEVLAWDDTLRARVLEVFAKLDQVQKHKREQDLADQLKRQMIIDDVEQGTLQSVGEVVMVFMEQLRGKATWTARDAQDALAIAQAGANNGQGAVPANVTAAAAAEKKTQMKQRWYSAARGIITAASVGLLVSILSEKTAEMDWYESLALAGEISQGIATVDAELKAIRKSRGVTTHIAADAGRWIYRYIFAPVGRIAVAIGNWLYNAVGRIGESLITGIRNFASNVANGIKTGLIKVYKYTIGRFVTYIKSKNIMWSKYFNALCNTLSFGVSVLCLLVAIRDCIAAWRSGRPFDKSTSTVAAVLISLEIIVLVVQGVAWLAGATATVSVCSTIGTVLGVIGIIFTVVVVVLTFTHHEDPLDDLVEKYGKKYGLLN